ncbi:MAG: hypothetical protein BroJett018_49940 [Chloroflexota bacterium]|nr:hypothetical protein [Chloroflexota bacterium]NOG64400.1 hypothetical protein [Chloroflexota bacterium]GIK67200.1 MAG: hypothetical protein BroJett018_49940 [Chloroflexota bacterium]
MDKLQRLSLHWSKLSTTDHILIVCFGSIVVSMICIGIALVGGREINSYLREYDERLVRMDDSANYILDFRAILGSDWQTSQGIQRDREDLRGPSRAIAGRSRVFGWNMPNQVALIDYHIITYTNEEKAEDRYYSQKQWIFKYQMGIPPEVQQFPWKRQNLASVTISADKFYMAHREIFDSAGQLMSQEYTGLFLYNNHIVYINISTRSLYIDYLSEEQITQIYRAIDERMRP